MINEVEERAKRNSTRCHLFPVNVYVKDKMCINVCCIFFCLQKNTATMHKEYKLLSICAFFMIVTHVGTYWSYLMRLNQAASSFSWPNQHRIAGNNLATGLQNSQISSTYKWQNKTRQQQEECKNIFDPVSIFDYIYVSKHRYTYIRMYLARNAMKVSSLLNFFFPLKLYDRV